MTLATAPGAPLPPEADDQPDAAPDVDPWRRRHGRHARRSRLSTMRAGLSVAAGLAAVAVYRTLVIGLHGEPAGVDFGNWLMLGHQVLGHPLPGAASIAYPPLVPVAAVVATRLLGVLWADAVLLGVAGVAPAAGVYLAARINGVRWAAVPGVLLLAATSSTGEPVAWGGAPQLLGFGFGAVAVGCAARVARSRSRRDALALGAALLAVGTASHLVLAQVVLTVGLVVVVQLVTVPRAFGRGTWGGAHGWWGRAALAAGPLVLLVPLYTRLISTVGQSFASQDQVAHGWPSFLRFLENLSVVHREAVWVWKPALVLAALTPIVLGARRHRGHPLWLVTTAFVLSLVVQSLLSGEPRLAYLAPVGVVFTMAFWTDELASDRVGLPGGHRTVAALVVVSVAASGFAAYRGLTFFPTQRDFYGRFLARGSVAGLDWVRHHTPPHSLILVAPESGAPFGWWVQGYGERAALVGSEDRWLNFPDERRRARQAVAVLSTPHPLGEPALDRARHLDVDYLLLPWNWGGLSKAELRAFRSRHPRAVVFDNHAMVLIDLRA